MLPASEHRPNFDRNAGSVVAFMASLVAHVSLILVLACWVYAAGKSSNGLLIQAEVGESESASLDMLQTYELEQQAESSAAPQATTSELSLNVKLDHLLQTAPSELSTESLLVDLASAAASTATDSGVDTADGREVLQERGYGRGANFFGSHAYGDRFVFVVDSSSSMTGPRWNAACDQLITSIEQLDSGQEFFVICFDYQTTYLFNLPPHRLKYSTKTEKSVRGVRSWLASRTLGRATMPAEALQVALSLNPDAVFLLSDGELQDESLLMLRMINAPNTVTRQIPINTISLYSGEGWLTLQQIAADNGGSFTPVMGN
ncbi:MAG: vWA domain-containing protein [Aureliella sp.]